MNLFLQLLLFVMFSVEALSAERHVSFVSTNQLNLFDKASSEGEGSISATDLANGSKLLDFLSFRNEVDDVLKASSHESTIES